MLAATALAGCGTARQVGESAAEDLHRGVDAVRSAAAADDRDGALRALQALSARVRQEEADGALAESDAAGLRRGIARAKRRVQRELAATEPTPESTPEATPEPTPEATPEPTAAPPGGEKPGKGPKPGKGNEDDGKGGDR